MKKILLITNIPNPYRVPLFNELNEQFLKEDMQLKVVFASSGYKRRLFTLSKSDFKFDYITLDGGIYNFEGNPEKTTFRYKGLWELLRKEKPDKIIVSGFSIATMTVFLWKLRSSTPFLIWSGSIEKENRTTGILRSIQRTLLMKAASAFIVYGSKAREYLVKAGVSDKKICTAINTVDTNYFYEETTRLRKNNNQHNRVITFIYLGYLVPRKNVQLLLEAILQVSKKRRDFKLEIIGEGSSKPELENFVINHQLQEIVRFEGFRQKNELPAYFAKSSGLLFQTDFDIWGLVLNEAMAAGLPCLASTNAGATYDLIEDGVTGFVVNFTDIQAIAEKIIRIIDHQEESKEMGERAADFIRTKANLAVSAKGFLEALKITK
jgi:glycosyltransferase involved in cell wall biosynthesis